MGVSIFPFKANNKVDFSNFHCRLARPLDREAIANLCKRAVGPNDYVLAALDGAIRKKGLFIAISKSRGELIGISNFTQVFDRSGWMGMARTDPKWRGLGVAQFLQRRITSYAKLRGLRCLRFFVASSNISSLRAARKGGFRSVAECAHVSMDVSRKSSLLLAKIGDRASSNEGSEQKLPRRLSSQFVARMNGYLRYGDAFVAAKRKNMMVIKDRGELFSESGCSFVLVGTGRDEGEFGLLSGDTSSCLQGVIKRAQKLEMNSIGGFLPADHIMIRTALGLGFKLDEWGSHCFLFEKKI